MFRTAASTTSLSTGVRLTGFQVYANAHPLPKHTSKKYGKTTVPEHLPDGIARFFPFHIPVAPFCMPPSIPAASSVPPSGDVVTAPDDIQQGLPPRTLLVLLTRLLESLERLRAALATAKATASGKGLDGNAQGAHDEEGEDKETITVAIYEHGHLIVDVMAAEPRHRAI
ncbi:hypothetical protein PISMIDRAFT_19206 [Pisolithus microcarpus 441]|uniref:Uncharacterized protein n=1 Tax=Pisolithus microcarpus 441 TaxID=765257 RepID=A0A0C9XHL8_9AGAM|nr:hypothetical protein PISMIDRAFT_19206 [Pisolithus microcarpus 441]